VRCRAVSTGYCGSIQEAWVEWEGRHRNELG
jgi:hypothetical protein